MQVEVNDHPLNEQPDLENLGNLCRSCASPNGHMVPIFEGEGLHYNLQEKINTYLPITVSENDALPRQLCYHCAATILSYHEISEGCLAAQQKLMQLQEKLNFRPQIRLEQYINAVNYGLIKEEQKVSTLYQNAGLNHNEFIGPSEILSNSVENDLINVDDEALENLVNKVNKDRFYSVAMGLDTLPDAHNKLETILQNIAGENGNSVPMFLSNHGDSDRNVYEEDGDDNHENEDNPVVNEDDDDDSENESDVDNNEDEDEDSEIDENDIYREDIQFINCQSPEECFTEAMQSINGRGIIVKCLLCSAKFLNVLLLATHTTEKHSNVSESKSIYHCCECQRPFKFRTSLIRHLKIHQNERAYTCHVCGKQFCETGGLTRHLKEVHAKLKRFACDICGKNFASNATRNDHRRTHTDERPYACKSCGKNFKSKSSLYVHNKTHTNDFPHPCLVCVKKFRRKQELVVHMTTHTGEKNYTCDTCQKKFRVKSELVRHSSVHTNEKPFACSECGLKYRLRRYLLKHNKIKHSKSNS